MKIVKKKEGFKGQRAIILPRNIISLQCNDNDIIGQSYITDIGYYPKAQFHYRKRAHGIDQNVLIYCVEGSGSAQIGDNKYSIDPGNFIVIPAGVPHSYAADEDHAWTIYWIHFKGKISDAMSNLMVKEFKGYKGTVNYSEKRTVLFDEIYTNLEKGYGTENIYYANMCLWQFISSFIFDNKFNFITKTATNDISSHAIDFMQKHLDKTLKLSEIAHAVNTSVSHFAAVFRNKTGFAPIEYFNHLKIQKACQYLQFTEDRVREIAYNLGIEDLYYFSRLFKKVMGVSPNEYRKKRNL
jgi:AraC-like DNA-binding protein